MVVFDPDDFGYGYGYNSTTLAPAPGNSAINPTDERGQPGQYPSGGHGSIVTGGPPCPGGVLRYETGADGVARQKWVCPDGTSSDPNRPGDVAPSGGGAPRGGGSTGGGIGGGGFNYTAPTFPGSAAPSYNIPPAPELDIPSFNAPDPEGIFQDPSYQFRLREGQRALENSASARGLTRSGPTVKGLQDYAQNYASQEFGNIFNRALQTWQANVQEAVGEFDPRFREWGVRAQANQRQGDLAWQREWDEWVFRINDQFRREQMIFEARD